MIFPRVHYAFAEFRRGRRFGPPLNTPLNYLVIIVVVVVVGLVACLTVIIKTATTLGAVRTVCNVVVTSKAQFLSRQYGGQSCDTTSTWCIMYSVRSMDT